MASTATRSILAVTLLAALAIPRTAPAKTFVIPHVLESSGKITDIQYTFDTQIFVTYSGGLAGTSTSSGSTVSLYLYDRATNGPWKSATNTDVCNPCMYQLDHGGTGGYGRKHTIVIDDEIVAKGGYPSIGTLQDGYAIIVVGGDVDNTQIQGFVVNSHTGPFDLAAFPLSADAPGAADPCTGQTRKVFVLPHILERTGKISNTQNTSDSQIAMTYSGGLAGLPTGGGATVDLYLFDEDTSFPMQSQTAQDVCNPCSFDIGTPGGPGLPPTPRKRVVTIDDLITAKGGVPPGTVKLGFGILVIGGADPENVNLQGFVVNAHTSPFDLSVFGFDPQPMQAAVLAVKGSNIPGPILALRGSPNPSTRQVDLSFQLARASNVKLEVFDAAGRRVANLLSGERAAGNYRHTWEPKDESGNRLHSGIYFGKLTTDDGASVTRLVMLPD